MALRFTLRQLEYLVAVADCGWVALAAQQINVASPSISAAIARLEREFGLQRCIRRHAQGLSLTESGRQFTAAARCVLAAAGRPRGHAVNIAGRVAGVLSTGCLLTFAQVVLPQRRCSFANRYPEGSIFPSDRAPDGKRLAVVPLTGPERPVQSGRPAPPGGGCVHRPLPRCGDRRGAARPLREKP